MFSYITRGVKRNHYAYFDHHPAFKTDIFQHIQANISNEQNDWYMSLYNYKPEHIELHTQRQSMAGFNDLTTSRLYFDFDHEENLGVAAADTKDLVMRLLTEYKVPEEVIQIYFSGNKGFGIEIELDEQLTKPQFKNLVFNLASQYATFDVKIHDYQRIIRIPYTKHEKSQAWKCHVSLDQLDDWRAYPERAKQLTSQECENGRQIYERTPKYKLNEYLSALKDVPYEKTYKLLALGDVDIVAPEKALPNIDFNKCPQWLPKEKYAILCGGAWEGIRHASHVALIATLKRQGYPKELCITTLLQVAEAERSHYDLSKATSRDEIERDVNSVYADTWQGGTFGKDHPLMVEIRRHFNIPEQMPTHNHSGVYGNSELIKRFSLFASNLKTNRIYTGLPFDRYLTLMPQMRMDLLGAPSSGKSTVMLQILKNTSKAGIESALFGLDMADTMQMAKQISLCTGDTYDDILSAYDTNNTEKMKHYASEIHTHFGNVHYCTDSATSVADIRVNLAKLRSEGRNIKLVVIDYLECIRGEIADQNADMTKTSAKLRDLAKEQNVLIILLVQPPKSSGGAAFPLTNLYQVKGPATIVQDARIVIGIYRLGYNTEDCPDKYISFAGLKNTMGQNFTVDAYWTPTTGVGSEIKPTFDTNGDAAQVKLIRDARNRAKYKMDDKNGFAQKNEKPAALEY